MGGNKTGISWTDESYQITAGCQHAGTPACDHCYAEEFAGRFAEEGQPFHGLVQIRANGRARWTGRFDERPDRLARMIGWRGQKDLGRRTRVFIGSMTDTFKEEVSDIFLAAAFAVFGALGDTHTLQLLTKRTARARAFFGWLRAQTNGYEPERLTRVLLDAARNVLGEKAAKKIEARLVRWRGAAAFPPFPFRNVHLGATVENEAAADLRIHDLLACDAAVYWLSLEPLFEAFRFTRAHAYCPEHDTASSFCSSPCPSLRLPHWGVIGLESGNLARPGHVEHVYRMKYELERIGALPFVKQLGTRPLLGGKPLKLRHPHGARMEEWPEDLRVQKWPED